MEWCVPLQKLEVGKVHLGPLYSQQQITIGRPARDKKPVAPLGYVDGQIVLPSLNILLPLLTVQSYNAQTGRLEVSIDNAFSVGKLQALQQTLLNAITVYQQGWFNSSEFTHEDILHAFQPMIENNILHLYCPVIARPQNVTDDQHKYTGNLTRIWANNEWQDGLLPGVLKSGQRIRIALQIQGISLQLQNDEWTGRSRLQHRILGILIQNPPVVQSNLVENTVTTLTV